MGRGPLPARGRPWVPPQDRPPNARYWLGFNDGRAMERGQQTTPLAALAGDEHYRRGVEAGRQSIRDDTNPPQFSAPYIAAPGCGARTGDETA